jgi:2-oxoisovalerate dehydrogenase E2 component (dihydrolipoyl transacylase)
MARNYTLSACPTSAKALPRPRSSPGTSRSATGSRRMQPLADMMTDKATVEMESPVAGTVIVSVAGAEGDMHRHRRAAGGDRNRRRRRGTEEALPPRTRRKTRKRWPSASTPKRLTPRLRVMSPEVEAAVAGAAPPPAAPDPVRRLRQHPPPRSKVLASPAVRARAQALGNRSCRCEAPPRMAGCAMPILTRSWPTTQQAAIARGVAWAGSGHQGHRSAPPDRREHGRVQAQHPALLLCRGMRRHRAGSDARAAQRRARIAPQADHAAAADHRDLPALPEFPMLNARYDDEAGVVHRFGRGPPWHGDPDPRRTDGAGDPRRAGPQPVAARRRDRPAGRSRAHGTAKSEELSGSTITITSLGPLGGVAHTPVINRPEVAIIGPNRIVERPMFVPDGTGGERIEKRKLMNLSISCDHRVVDGWDAASFRPAAEKHGRNARPAPGLRAATRPRRSCGRLLERIFERSRRSTCGRQGALRPM